MDLLDVVRRQLSPVPWSEAKKIPWHEPGFSERMLAEHLSQAHDAASRRLETIDRQVDRIHGDLLSGRPARVLDLGCGPGLYSSRLARLGHRCVGVDFSPASLAHARSEAERDGLDCRYVEADLRQIATLDLGSEVGLVMMLSGEFNAFRRQDALQILGGVGGLLAPRGVLLVEASTFESVRAIGARGASWWSSEKGLFAADPHLCLHECFWDEARAVASERWWIVDAASGAVERLSQSLQAYTDEGYAEVFAEAGFAAPRRLDSLSGVCLPGEADLLALVAGRA